MAAALDFINVPAMMAGLGPAVHSLTVRLSINVQEKESVCPPTCAAVSQDSLGRTVVRYLAVVILATAADKVFAFCPMQRMHLAGNVTKI